MILEGIVGIILGVILVFGGLLLYAYSIGWRW